MLRNTAMINLQIEDAYMKRIYNETFRKRKSKCTMSKPVDFPFPFLFVKERLHLKKGKLQKTLTKSSDYPEQKGRYNNYFVLSWKQGEVFNKLQWMQVNWVGHYILLICIWMISCRCLHFDRIKSEKSRLLVQKKPRNYKKRIQEENW